jgi:hypothetical protein
MALLKQTGEEDVASWRLRLLEAVYQREREFAFVEVFAEALLGGVLMGSDVRIVSGDLWEQDWGLVWESVHRVRRDSGSRRGFESSG